MVFIFGFCANSLVKLVEVILFDEDNMELVKKNMLSCKIKTKPIKFLTLILLFILLYGINNTNIYNSSLTPFGISLVFALLYVNFNGYILGGIYFVTYLLACGINFNTILIAGNVASVIVVAEFFVGSGKLKLSRWKMFALLLVSLVLFIALNVSSIRGVLATIVAVVLSIFFLYSSLCFLDATIGKGLLNKISLDEKICGSVILLIFAIGISSVNIDIISIGLIFSVILILLSTKLMSSGYAMIVSSLLGVGFAISNTNSNWLVLFTIMSLSAIAFKTNWRILSCIALALVYVGGSLLFEFGLSVGEVISVLLGCLVYFCIPNKLLQEVSNIFIKISPLAHQKIFATVKEELVARIRNLSLVFEEMSHVYRNMVKGNLTEEKAKELLREETIRDVCDLCSNKDRCFRSKNSFMDNCFDKIIDVGYEKGKLLLVDLPEYLTTNCAKVGQLLMSLNSIFSAYAEYKSAVHNIDTSRVLVADQLSGISLLLESLSKEVNVDVSIDNRYDSAIKEALGYAGILCVETLIYEQGIDNCTLILIVNTNTINDTKIIEVVNKVMNGKFKINNIEGSSIIGASVIVLKSLPNYNIAFGSASITKSGNIVSGDSHMVVDVGDGKYIATICDGMGSGGRAKEISSLTLNLIENFYRAGFENDIILSSVNKLLSLDEQENFSTIDLCAIDSRKCTYDFIKLGASNGYIRRSSGDVEIISSSGLPIGVLDNIKPHITKKRISPMDIIILVSDGVSDALGEKLYGFILNSDNINPQILSKEILNYAVEVGQGVACDDMTVLCVRVFENV